MEIIDLKKNTVVESGAGCGKTYQLVKAFIRGLKEKKYQIDEAVAITFTIKAAAELKERVIIAIEDEIAKNNNSAETRHLQQQLLKIGNSNISTIHSFCIRILKERPVEAGVDPNFEVLPEEDYGFFRQTYSDWLRLKADEFFDFLDETVLVRQILLRRPHNDSFDAFKQPLSLEELMMTMIEHRELDFYVPTQGDHYDLKTFYEDAAKLVEETNHPQLKMTMSSKLLPIRQAIQMPAEKAVRHLHKTEYKLRTLGGAEWKDLRHRWANHFESNLDRATNHLIFPQLKKYYLETNKALASFRQFYREKMRQESVIDFSEILVKTEELLRTNREARFYFKNRFRFFFVDEFQDTDPLQAQILSYLCESKKSFTTNWREVEFAPGKICVVGDIKQSIYRFRRADIETFLHMTKNIKLSKSGAEAKLSINRRSTQSIIKFVNQLFGKRMQPTDANQVFQTNYEEMQPLETAAEGEKVLYVDPITEIPAKNVAAYRNLEAKLTALTIKKLIEERGFSASDITVLYRVKANMEHTADYLNQLGIPSMMYGVTSYLARREVREVSYLLQALDNPLDSIAVVATLKGMFFNATDEDFYSLVEAQKSYSTIYYSFPDYRYVNETNGGSLAESFALLSQWHNQALEHPPHILLEKILTARGTLAALMATYNGRQKVYNLMKATVLLARMQDLSFSQAVTKFKEYIDTTPEMPELSFERNESQVQLMTIHAAKGLENRAVYLADTIGGASFGNKFFANNFENKLVYMLDQRFKPADFNQYAVDDSQKEEAEVERLRYVAATRAKELLLINRTGYESSRSPRFITPFYDEMGGAQNWQIKIDHLELEHGRLEELVANKNSQLTKEKKQIKEQVEQALASLGQITFQSISPSEIKETEEFDQEFRIEVSLGDEDFNYYLEKVPQHVLGRIIHKMLELGNEVAAENAAQQLIRENRLSITTKDIMNIYRSYLKNPILDEVAHAKNVYRELPIKYPGEDGKLYDGTIDLLFETEKGYTLADFKVLRKTSKADQEAIKEKYKPQLAAYKKGLELIGINVTKIVVII